MPKRSDAAYDLTDAEKSDLIKRIQLGEPLDDR